MPLAQPLRQLIDAKLAQGGPPQWEQPIAEVRRNFAALWGPTLTATPPAVAHIEERSVPGRSGTTIPVRIYDPVETSGHLLMYFHGGGYVKGGLDEADAFCRRLARTTGRIVVAVDYRLAPEHPFPAALDDAWDATSWAFLHAAEIGGMVQGFAVSGESAGGNLAAVVSFLARSGADVMIDRQVLLQPVLDFTLSYPSIAMSGEECLVPRDDLAWYYQEYYGSDRDPRDPMVSPLWAEDLAGLPATLVVTAEYDSLRDEAYAYAERLQAAGVAVEYACYEGMVHGFLQMAGLVDAAQQAIEQIAAFLRCSDDLD